jgi:hypothetical protein
VNGENWIKKVEMHATLISYAAKLDKIVKAAQAEKGEPMSNKNVKAHVKEVLARVAENSTFKIDLSDEYRRVEKGEKRTIIQIAAIEGQEEFIADVEQEFGIESGSLPMIPGHVTIFTGEDGKSIAISSAEELDEISEPIELNI